MMRKILAAGLALAAAGCASASRTGPDTESARLYVEEGREASRRGDHDRAVDLFSDAIRAHPEFAEAFLGRANARIGLRLDPHARENGREYEERALRDYSLAIRYNPAYAEAYFNRAMLLSSRAQYRRAAEDLINATKFAPDDPEAHLYLGRLYEEKFEGREIAAIEHYEQYVDLGGDDPKVRETVRQWKELRQQAVPPAADRTPTPEEEEQAAALHEAFTSRLRENNRDGALEALTELLSKYAHTQYVRGRQREFQAVLRALNR